MSEWWKKIWPVPFKYRVLIGFLSAFVILSIVGTTYYFLTTAQVGNGANQLTNPVYLTMIPSKPTAIAGELIDIDIYAHPNGNELSAAELHIGFDENIVETAMQTPFIVGSELTEVLPNCAGGQTPPCTATSSATLNSATIILGAKCTDGLGCNTAPVDTSFLLATLKLKVKPDYLTNGLANISIEASGSATTRLAAIGSNSDVTGMISATSISVGLCSLAYDLNPNGIIDVVDIMKASSAWSYAPGDTGYNGQYDFDFDHDIDIVDIQKIASSWGQKCTP